MKKRQLVIFIDDSEEDRALLDFFKDILPLEERPQWIKKTLIKAASRHMKARTKRR